MLPFRAAALTITTIDLRTASRIAGHSFAIKIVEGAARAAGDNEVDDRIEAVHSTARMIVDGVDDLLFLAPDIQEEILFSAAGPGGAAVPSPRRIRRVAAKAVRSTLQTYVDELKAKNADGKLTKGRTTSPGSAMSGGRTGSTLGPRSGREGACVSQGVVADEFSSPLRPPPPTSWQEESQPSRYHGRRYAEGILTVQQRHRREIAPPSADRAGGRFRLSLEERPSVGKRWPGLALVSLFPSGPGQLAEERRCTRTDLRPAASAPRGERGLAKRHDRLTGLPRPVEPHLVRHQLNEPRAHRLNAAIGRITGCKEPFFE